MGELEATECETPFRHWVIDNAYNIGNQFLVSLPKYSGKWAVYANDHERKRSCNDLDNLPLSVNVAVKTLLEKEVAQSLCVDFKFDIDGIRGDDTLHGGGLHVTDPGGFLAPHIDYALHPHIPNMERRLNAILFLDDWQEQWGGALCFYDDMGNKVVTRIYPKRGRLVLWEPTDTSFHGCEVVTGPQSRHTIAVYYLAPARPTATRKRALFVPSRSK
jgi:Rps23 Pro-64 3,4-dihydroxylase Tpa1-like proline 4-hydroxylase